MYAPRLNALSMTWQTNPTQVAGLLAFAASAAACAWAWHRSRRAAWGVLAAVHALLWLDILLNTRHRLHDAVNAALTTLGVYGLRAPLQVALLLALAALAAWAWRRRRGAGLAGVATLALLALLLVEAISWHESDRLLYTHLGPLLLIAYGWIAGAAVVVWASLRR
jgi:hypothetical protein